MVSETVLFRLLA